MKLIDRCYTATIHLNHNLGLCSWIEKVSELYIKAEPMGTPKAVNSKKWRVD